MSGPTNGEFSFTLKEKTDRFRNMYLFGAIHFFNCVIFVRPTGQPGADGLPKWYAKVKPYTGQQQDSNPDEDVWADDPPNVAATRRQR